MSTTESETLVGGQGRVGPSGEAGSQTYVYFFGEGHAEGHGAMKDVLGGKGAGLAEMTNAGVPVPPGFTISTAVCRHYHAHDHRLPEAFAPSRTRRWPGSSARSAGRSARRTTRCSSQSARAPSSRCPA